MQLHQNSHLWFWLEGVQPKSLSQFLIFCQQTAGFFSEQPVFDVKFLVLRGEEKQMLEPELYSSTDFHTPPRTRMTRTSSSSSRTCCSSSPILAFFLSLAVCAATLFLSFLRGKTGFPWCSAADPRAHRPCLCHAGTRPFKVQHRISGTAICLIILTPNVYYLSRQVGLKSKIIVLWPTNWACPSKCEQYWPHLFPKLYLLSLSIGGFFSATNLRRAFSSGLKCVSLCRFRTGCPTDEFESESDDTWLDGRTTEMGRLKAVCEPPEPACFPDIRSTLWAPPLPVATTTMIESPPFRYLTIKIKKILRDSPKMSDDPWAARPLVKDVGSNCDLFYRRGAIWLAPWAVT